MSGDRTIYSLFNRKMVKMNEPQRPALRNFVIVCELGDWSGFRTLAECEAQFPQLETAGRGNFFYRVVER
jgi:hypothetical protein